MTDDAATNVTPDISSAMIEFPAGEDSVPGYLAAPTGQGPFPAMVVIQEWWGLNDHIKDVAERFARQGFAALAPDLYRGQVTEEPDEARKLAMELEFDRAITDIQGAVDYVLKLKATAPNKAGVIGFCMGGRLAHLMSLRGQNVGAVAVFYGGGVALTNEEAQQVSAPYLGIFGAEDQGIPQEQIDALRTQLEAHNKPHSIHMYEGAGHAFFNDTRESAYHAEAAQDAWQKALAWFEEYVVE